MERDKEPLHVDNFPESARAYRKIIDNFAIGKSTLFKMENRKEELYSQVISAGKRRYFFDVKETRGGDKFITITESRRIFDNNAGEFYYDKNKVFLYKEDFEKFQKGLANAFSFIETGVEPEPVATESADLSNGGDDLHPIDIDDIDLNF